MKIKKLIIDLLVCLFIGVVIVPLLIVVMLVSAYTFLTTWPKEIISVVDRHVYDAPEKDT